MNYIQLGKLSVEEELLKFVNNDLFQVQISIQKNFGLDLIKLCMN